jgi:flagellar hook protein FlgE
MGQGNIEATGRDLDVALQGSGLFVARNGTQTLYTRTGAFGIDSNNYLIDPATGARIQRYGNIGEGNANSPAFQVPADNDIKIPTGTTIPGKATAGITLQGNLSANATTALAQVLTSATPFKAGGVAATTSTLLNSLDDNNTDYVAGDQIRLQGEDASNNPVSVQIPVDGTTTMGDLINDINANFPGATASLDSSGNLILTANATGPTNLNLVIADVNGNTGNTNWGNHTMNITTTGKNADVVRTSIQVYDAQGTAHNVSLDFTKISSNSWNMAASMDPKDGTLLDNSVTGITFNDDGSFRQVTGTGLGDDYITIRFPGEAATQTISMNFGSMNGFDGLTHMGGTSSAAAIQQDGFPGGSLTAISIGSDGVITGSFSNGRSLQIAQFAIAIVANPAALNRVGNNYYTITNQSGPPLLGTAQFGGRGAVQQQALESSNVDISTEFTNLIVAQRGFQVNSRTITVSDQIIQDLVNIIH